MAVMPVIDVNTPLATVGAMDELTKGVIKLTSSASLSTV